MDQDQSKHPVKEIINPILENKALITHHQRLYSLDALRGFDMFWIIGGGIVHGNFLAPVKNIKIHCVAKRANRLTFESYDIIFDDVDTKPAVLASLPQ